MKTDKERFTELIEIEYYKIRYGHISLDQPQLIKQALNEVDRLNELARDRAFEMMLLD
ncbi:hypothetical protein [Flavobacterium filum]|uniref:hypothetical protein n=1 Tax=Flavobacterium filum TaxID=370974 RepID=UPI0023F42B27|nr:hypothetical protein [Flavobacterium filum]